MNFEEAALPHLDAAYNLARWLTRNEDDAQDVVQEAYLRALRFFDGFRGSDARAWLLTIVRNTCYTWLKRKRSAEIACDFDEAEYARESAEPDPETLQIIKAQTQLVAEAIERLPDEFREVVVLRELEELSYKEIAAVTGVPIGTVMSRLARARKRLLASLTVRPPQRAAHALHVVRSRVEHRTERGSAGSVCQRGPLNEVDPALPRSVLCARE
ncbi:MAG TPA: sigma-70 family RNA polymerase sigma factor [Pyrinomonadaceae bacterium]